ncbi:TonB-dependent receptor [Pedobacter antarcticus]|uniref:TonB-dependent receptor n=1 Tax=Pedobacter antarcticus TaxID=34086 RepID=UPI0008917ED4|nr:TonB-dependent receptor [Pedobacter antarcticus]SDM65097.1 TonB-dependent receptor [Pedobacter antarcticus]
MKPIFKIILCFFLSITVAKASNIKGHVYDKKTGEALVGASVRLENTDKVTMTGLDGSFEFKKVKAGLAVLKVSYVTYQTFTRQLNVLDEDNPSIQIYLSDANGNDLNEVVIGAKHDGASERTARKLEQKAMQVTNVVSGRAMEISPDLTVANVVQRVSGVSIERSSNGGGQYAILRGMDKRYNYTLVNGIKIASSDDKFRYVPLDVFPTELLQRLEVYKSLTPNMEGDAVGGVINMVMKDAPAKLEINANLAGGYNQMLLDRKFLSFDAGALNAKSPYEINGKNYNSKSGDFSNGAVDYKAKQPAPNVVGGLSIGQRFLDNRLGVIIAGSYQNNYTATNSTFYNSTVAGTDAVSRITSQDYRQYSEQQKRYGLHGKIDYTLNKNNKLALVNSYVNLTSIQTRDVLNTNFSNADYNPGAGNAQLTYQTRSRLAEQQIYNTTLQGEHKLFNEKLKINWSGVYSSAKNDVPEETSVTLNGLRTNFLDQRTTASKSTRRWSRNTDEDKAGYLDLTYSAAIAGLKVDFTAGGLYRDKQRSSFYNNYVFEPSAPKSLYGVDFNNYTEINWDIQNPKGAVANSLTYNASEKTTAGYGMFNVKIEDLEVVGGVRVEHTNQGYDLLFPAGESKPKGSQVYTDVLPSLNLKYGLTAQQNLRASYFRSLNRPGFYEIVPSKVVYEEYTERGNPDLKRAIADNFDLRYEFFPNSSDQLLIGGFYKNIQDPIEYTIQADTRGDLYYSAGNFGNAKNYGLELDYVKFISKFGFKANYTYTHSRITTSKTSRIRNSAGDLETISVEQTRPLYGQAAHIANLSLLYKDTQNGWDAQLAGSYTGDRINTVSQFVDNDLWQKGFIQMDASVEKKFKNKISVFIKAGNLLNTPTTLFIKGVNAVNAGLPDQKDGKNETLIRKDYYEQTYLLGLRYKL